MDYNYTKEVTDYLQWKPTLTPKEISAYVENLKNFYSFSEGIETLLERKKLPVDSENDAEKEAFILKKLEASGTSIKTKETIKNWIRDKHSPKIEHSDRQRVYELCFALGAEYEKVTWFFAHVYGSRAFNCHNLEEAVYYYCFKHKRSYQDATDILKKVRECTPEDEETECAEDAPGYTKDIQKYLERDELTPEELIGWLTYNIESFNNTKMNIRARERIKDFLQEIFCSKEMEEEIRKLKLGEPNHVKEYIMHKKKDSGLYLRRLYKRKGNWPAFKKEVTDIGKVTSRSLVLKDIMGTDEPQIAQFILDKRLKMNFPSKHTLSTILNDKTAPKSTSYEKFRKMLILLYFYIFWCHVGLEEDNSQEDDSIFEIFQQETDEMLADCGYEELTKANPFDTLILLASRGRPWENSGNDEKYFPHIGCLKDVIGELTKMGN